MPLNAHLLLEVSHELVNGLIAGGDIAIRKAVEFAEDSTEQGWKDLQERQISSKDIVIGIAASGTTPYVISALEMCNKNNIITGCITCNENSPLGETAKFPIVVVVGPEFVTGSSRMKAGNCSENGFKYDFNSFNDSIGECKRK